jgi:hypothetical protein
MAITSHVQEGTDPGPYNSDPPTSGKHYDPTYQAGFYDESDTETQNLHPEGFLVHNLEHGYVIFWYNCNLLDEQECTDLKTQIQGVMDEAGGTKLIAFPRESIEEPVVMTSWGRMLRFEEFDPAQARDFIQRNLNKAPEPNAP